MEHIINKSFGYPVLRESSDDYNEGTYEILTDIMPIDDNGDGEPAKWKIIVDIDLSNPDLKELVKQNDAEFIVIISCPLTFYQRYESLTDKRLELDIDAALVQNQLNVNSYLVAKKEIKNFTSNSFHEDYDGIKFDLKKGMVLAIADPDSYYVNTKLLADISSIFILTPRPDLKDYEWSLDYNQDLINFYVNDNTFQHISENETNGFLQLNALILPAVIEILFAIKENHDELSHYKWFKAIENQAMNLDYEDILSMLEDSEFHLHAQKLCQHPLALAGGER